jgi:DNA-binding NarL/FixJ family response regulator
MISTRNPEPIRIGLLADEPIRIEGLASIFEEHLGDGHPSFCPIVGNMKELLADSQLAYLVVDLHCTTGGIGILNTIRRLRPDIRLIVIGPEGSDQLVLDSIMAGARAYLDLKAGPRIVCQAIEVVTSGSIWAPRRLLSKLIDRLLKVPDSSLTASSHHLTDRERQVLDLILTARSNREIARQLGIEERTVKAHVGRLMRKSGVDNRLELSMRALNGSLFPRSKALDRRSGTLDRRRNPASDWQVTDESIE